MAAGANVGKKLSKAFDVYRKIDPELTRATPTGAVLSFCGILMIFCLFFMEVRDFWTPEIDSQVVLDPGLESEEIRINFNLTVERVACPYITVELHNQIGTHRLNISKNVDRFMIKTKGELRHTMGKMVESEPRRILIGEVNLDEEQLKNKEVEPETLTPKNFEQFIASRDVVLVNFFAPWCIWCKKLHPLWYAVAHDFAKDFPGNQVGIAWVDCTNSEQVALCHSNHINAFPTILTFKNGDSHSIEQYHGDRTMDAFRAYAQQQLSTVRKPVEELHPGERALKAVELEDKLDGDGQYSPAVEGCRLEGFILAPKVPGTLVFATHTHGQSFDAARLNVSHEIHHFSFGSHFSKEVLAAFPTEVSNAMHKMDGQRFESPLSNLTHEHFLKIVGSTYTLNDRTRFSYYKYLHYSSPFHASHTSLPTIRMHFDITPMHVVVVERSKPFYRFITNLFAIIGGTFTVFGLLDSLLDAGHQAIKKKVQLGKQG